MAKELFTDEDKKAIVKAIKEAEFHTSGEIQVHIEKKCREDVLDRASKIFAGLNMHETKERNGVLFYLAVEDKKFAILGDKGINSQVPDNFWNEIKERMQQKFRTGNFTEGLCEGILDAGKALKAHFPYDSDDINELPDDISFGSN